LLRGRGKNSFAIGSKIKVYRKGEVYYREVIPSRGFQSCVDYRQVIGLGKAGSVDSMVITWPDGSRSVYDHPELNKSYELKEGEEKKIISPEAKTKWRVMLEAVKSGFDKHREDDYVDFYYERNIPELLSREGPRAAVGDVNGDGLEDVFICGAVNQAGQLYLQTLNGTFVKKQEIDFDRYADFEDIAALFFDCD